MKNYAKMGCLLRVDLTKGSLRVQESDPYMGEYLGGRGMGQKMLLDMMSPGIGALDPESVLIFAAGPLTGTLAPGSGRLSISGKNVLTGGVGSSNVGGHFGPELKYAGFDSIVVEGKSAHQVYLF